VETAYQAQYFQAVAIYGSNMLSAEISMLGAMTSHIQQLQRAEVVEVLCIIHVVLLQAQVSQQIFHNRRIVHGLLKYQLDSELK